MNWDVIGAVSTVLGVLGGFVSVYFLIHEVRRNALAIEGATVHSLMNFEQAVYAILIDNAALFVKGSQDRDSLSADARFKFDMVVQSYMSLHYSAFKQFEQGLIDAEVWQAFANAMTGKLQKPGFAASWAAMQTNYPRTFQSFITTLLPA
ncbi:MAG: hypothetical protein JNK34_00840 [Tabrizicola sp.]|nr:hypothetical protein [Tabrizicola sp.]